MCAVRTKLNIYGVCFYHTTGIIISIFKWFVFISGIEVQLKLNVAIGQSHLTYFTGGEEKFTIDWSFLSLALLRLIREQLFFFIGVATIRHFRHVHKVVCAFVPFLLAIVLSVPLRYTDSDYPFGILKLFIQRIHWHISMSRNVQDLIRVHLYENYAYSFVWKLSIFVCVKIIYIRLYENYAYSFTWIVASYGLIIINIVFGSISKSVASRYTFRIFLLNFTFAFRTR